MSLVNGIEIVQYQGSFVDFWELTHIYIVPYKQAVTRVGYTGDMFGEGLIFSPRADPGTLFIYDLNGSINYFLKFHYLSSNPNTTGNNCFFLETTPGASRVPSASGG